MAGIKQKDLFTKRWRNVVAFPQKECHFHIQLVEMLRWALRPDVMMRHVPNGELRDPRIAAKLKAMGTLPGSPDLEFRWCEIDPRYPELKLLRVLNLELKVGNRPKSEAQAVYELSARLRGEEYHVARSIDAAISLLGMRGLLNPHVEVCGRRW